MGDCAVCLVQYKLMASSIAGFLVSPPFWPNSELSRPWCRVLARSASGRVDSTDSSLESVAIYGTPQPPAPDPVLKKQGRSFESLMGNDEYLGPTTEAEDEKLNARMKEKNGAEPRSLDDGKAVEKLDLLWDDGYGSASVKDYLDAVKEIITADGGPPRWFCPVECGQPLKGSPVLLFLPGTFAFSLLLLYVIRSA